MSSNGSAFAIAHTLLDAGMAWPAWTNLGCWQRADGTALTTYPEAAEALARRVGEAAISGPGQYVVDLGCGHGASLLLWRDAFAAARSVGIESQQACVDAWQRQARPSSGMSLHRGRFDHLPLPQRVHADLPADGADAVVCVDAAYHADSLEAFVAVAHGLLRRQGRLAFSTVLRPDQASLTQRLQQRFMTRLSGIPAASVPDAEELTGALAQRGFADIRVAYLDEEVLQGFSAFVRRRAVELPGNQRRSLAWLKIAATGSFCDTSHAKRLLRYALVSATRAN